MGSEMCIRDSLYHNHGKALKGRVWSKIMFCVWLAFAVKIVVAMTAELNLAWFTRYEPRKQTVMTSLPSPSLGRALYNTMAFDPRKVLEEPNFATIEQNHIILFSVCCRHSILHVYEILLSEMKFLQKLGSSRTFRGSNAIVLYSARPSEGEGSDVITV